MVRNPWTAGQIAHIKKRFGERASSETIAMELKKLFNVERKPHTIYAKNQELKTPEEKAAGDRRKPANNPKLTIERAFNRMGITNPADRINDISFLSGLAKGKHAYLPGIGPVRSLGEKCVEATSGGTFVGNVIVLEQIYAKGGSKASPVKSYVRAENFLSRKVRPLSTKEEMAQIIQYLEEGSVLHKLPRLTHERLAVFNMMLRSPNIKDIADVIIHIYRPHNPGQFESISTTNSSKVEEALHMLASEYAAVMRVKYETALLKVTGISGRKSVADLAKEPGRAPQIL